jgi:hypothetical protein
MFGSVHLGMRQLFSDLAARTAKIGGGDMPKDSRSGKGAEAELATVAGRLLEDVKSEPIPDALMDLARQLEAAIAKRRADITK